MPASGDRALTAVLSRDRWVVGVCLATACGLAWLWLARAAAVVPSSDMPAMPGMAMPDTPAPGFAAAWISAFAMWLIMMVAMMLPSAAPMILLYSTFARRLRPQGAALVPTLVFAGIYLLLWAAFSALAALVQLWLSQGQWLSAQGLRLQGARVAGALLLLAGLYQLTPVKRACLRQCRAPLSFVTRLWRPGWAGAARLGLVHGAYCIGCCWLLMALLFVGGVMNLAWVAGLALIVLSEKVMPFGERGARAIGWIATATGLAMLAWPWPG